MEQQKYWELCTEQGKLAVSSTENDLSLRFAGEGGMDFVWDDLGSVSCTGEKVRWTRLVGVDCAEAEKKLTIVLENDKSTLRLTREFILFPDRPFVRSEGTVKNIGPDAVTVTDCMLLSVRPQAALPLAMMHVEQFSAKYSRDFFRPIEARLVPGRVPHEMHMGCYPSMHWQPTSCTWFALLSDLRKGYYDWTPAPGEGLVCGIEFNGKSTVRAWADAKEGHIVSSIDSLRHCLRPDEEFEIPAVFLGQFSGDWDEAGYVTQRFTETFVSPSMPDDRYPWAQYNSWAYDQDINEAQQMQAIERCAELGLELVVLDLGWAENVGCWRPDRKKFPRGLKPLAEKAHQYGMKFGVHVALAQCNTASPVAQEHPDWLINPVIDYFGAGALCLGHTPCREWLIEELSQLVKNEGIDYIVQDGEDMVKRCTRADHTHEPEDSNYSNSQKGLDVVISTLRKRFPHLVIENCEDGGCMLTYKMARLYHTSITVDNIDTYSTRQGIFGASYPFSPRYSVRYMQDMPTHYTLYSSIFGGPLIFMHRITEWTMKEVEQTKHAIKLYKQIRTLVRDAKIIHLLRPNNNIPGGGWGWDAIQAVSEQKDKSVVMVYRAQGDADEKQIILRGLAADRRYAVQMGENSEQHQMSGEELMEKGVTVRLEQFGAEIILIDKV